MEEASFLEPTVLAVITAIILIFATTIYLIFRTIKQKDTILIVGLCDSGKTQVFSKIANKNADSITTYTSLQENCVQLDIKGRPLKIIDFPGAERLRKQLVEKWLKKERDSLKKIVFVLDSASFTKRARDVAEFFYDVALESTKKVPIVVACNKQDLSLAKKQEVISSTLEKEIGLINKSRAAALTTTDGSSSNTTLTNTLDSFQWADLKTSVEFVDCSAIDLEEMFANIHFSTKVGLICIIWYAISSSSSILNKKLLQNYPFPSTVALSNLMLVPLFAHPLLKYWDIKQAHLNKAQYRRYLIPISVGKALAVASSYFTLYKVSVSYAHTVKASMPLFAVIFSHFILHERQSVRVYVALLPIVAGVIIASATELTFSSTAFGTALFSTGMYSFLNILVKKLLKDSDIHPVRLLAMNSRLAAVIFFPFWLYNDAVTMLYALNSPEPSSTPDFWMLFLLLIAGLLSFLQNLCAFSLIHKLTALSYSIAGCTKRIIIIVSALMTFHNPVTGSNIFGMSLAIFGVFMYNRAKQLDKHLSPSLPYTRQHVLPTENSVLELNNLESNDVMFRAASRGSAPNGSRLGDLDYSDTADYNNKMDDISREHGNRRVFRHA